MVSISFVIPAHNEAAFIQETLSAISATANSIGIEFEIIVVNDASTDDTETIATEFGARVIDVELRNIGAVRNAGANKAIHPNLVFVDADTIVPPKTLQQVITALNDGCVGGGAMVTNSKEKALPFYKQWVVEFMVLIWIRLGRWAAGCFMFCRKDVFNEFGGFDPKFYAAEEWFFSRAVKRHGKFRIVKHPVVTSSRKLHRYSFWQLLKFMTSPLRQGRKALKSRDGLEILYEDER